MQSLKAAQDPEGKRQFRANITPSKTHTEKGAGNMSESKLVWNANLSVHAIIGTMISKLAMCTAPHKSGLA